MNILLKNIICMLLMFRLCMNTMDDYNDLYLEKDVLLIAGVFEKFIDMCLEYYVRYLSLV